MNPTKANRSIEQSFVIIPQERLEAIEKAQEEILDLLKNNPKTSSESLNHIDEKKAIELVGKRATWFWQMRKTGQLKFTKVGAKVFYSLDEIKKLVREGSTN
jgi:hypothetical protein